MHGVYLLLSNLDFRVWLQKHKADNKLWFDKQTSSGVQRTFGTRCIQVLMCLSFTLSLLWVFVFVVWFWELTRWVYHALLISTPMQIIQFIMCEVCYLNGESGLQRHTSVSSQLSAVSFVAVCNPLMKPDFKSVESAVWKSLNTQPCDQQVTSQESIGLHWLMSHS